MPSMSPAALPSSAPPGTPGCGDARRTGRRAGHDQPGAPPDHSMTAWRAFVAPTPSDGRRCRPASRATQLSSWNSTQRTTELPSLVGGSTDTHLHNNLAPLPWLPGSPDRIANDPDWGPYLAARARLVTDLADQVRASSEATATWVAERDRALPAAPSTLSPRR
jgi:hypothetical protein